MYEPPLPVLSHRPHDRSLYSFLYIAWLRVFLQSIPFARRAPGALMFHIQHVNISMWRKSVECAIFAPMCCIRALENSRLAITVLTAPTLLSTDYVIDHCGCENWLRNLTLWLLSKLLCHLENCSYINMLLLETCEKFQPFLWLHFCFMWY